MVSVELGQSDGAGFGQEQPRFRKQGEAGGEMGSDGAG